MKLLITNKKAEGIIARIGSDNKKADYWITSHFGDRKHSYKQVICCTVEDKKDCEVYTKLKTKYPTTKIGNGIYKKIGLDYPSDTLLAAEYFLSYGWDVSVEGIKLNKEEEEYLLKRGVCLL